MHSLEVIQTIKWIDSLMGDEAFKKLLFKLSTLHRAREEIRGKTDAGGFYDILSATHKLSRISEAISNNPNAVHVLKFFGIQFLASTDFATRLGAALFGEVDQLDEKVLENVTAFPHRYTLMIESMSIWKSLILPDELQSEEFPEDILTLNVRTDEDALPHLEKITKVITLLESLYSVISQIYQVKDESKLELVKIESGTEIRIDCKGLGEPIKYLKEFTIEAWHKFRHKRPEEIIEKSGAVVSTLEAIERVEKSIKKKALTQEAGNRLKYELLKSTLGLFEEKAMIAEIPSQETIDNTKLLKHFTPKLLPEPKVKKSTKKPTMKKAKKTTKRR